jgi:hypothetical protein
MHGHAVSSHFFVSNPSSSTASSLCTDLYFCFVANGFLFWFEHFLFWPVLSGIYCGAFLFPLCVLWSLMSVFCAFPGAQPEQLAEAVRVVIRAGAEDWAALPADVLHTLREAVSRGMYSHAVVVEAAVPAAPAASHVKCGREDAVADAVQTVAVGCPCERHCDVSAGAFDRSIILTVRTLAGENHDFRVDHSITIRRVKMLLNERTGVPVREQRLVLGRLVLPSPWMLPLSAVVVSGHGCGSALLDLIRVKSEPKPRVFG